uniref:CHAD domain-containing protein n=1 Tax=Candidatus Kentrum sp. SD TaxID=2126332 RepID=A0A450YGU5_9GAMM|nr:MAG: CHAD domain-containing protein [Candidatus Kentron sp. SD]VFK46189.1 MAG: CHAD domain-containing protein [Candidatus Kentron sp. SD]
MSTTLEILSCKEIKPPRRLSRELEKTFPNIDDAPLRGRLCYLDTFDWRLYRRGWVLEVFTEGETREEQSGKGQKTRLLWRNLDDGHIHGLAWLDAVPVFSRGLPEGGHWAELGNRLEMRTLIPMGCVRIMGSRMVPRNGEDKAVVNVELYPAGGDTRIRMLDVRGFERDFRRALDVIESEFGCKKIKTDPARTAFEAEGREPGAYRPKPRIELTPVMRADEACKKILSRLLDVMIENESGVRLQTDTEFLHDFRVAVRSSRSLLGQVKAIFPLLRAQRFRRELAWLQEVTGSVRDMDVYLLEFPALQKELPTDEQRRDLLPMRTFIVARRDEAQKKLLRALDSARYRTFFRDWRAFLESPAPRHSTLLNATRPVEEVATQRIWRLFRRVIKEGKAITETGPADDLHELRKTCKKLRYLLEFFGDLFSREKIDPLVGALKILQDNLGTYQDLQVQQMSLGDIELAMREQGSGMDVTFDAMEALVASFAERERLAREAFAARFRAFSSKGNRKRFETLFQPRRSNGQ